MFEWNNNDCQMNLITKNILQDISNEINQYSLSNKGKIPTYIIINENDSISLLNEMHKAKMIPDSYILISKNLTFKSPSCVKINAEYHS